MERGGIARLLVEVVSALVVLLGLVFVGLELRQNTNAVQAATFQGLTDATNDAVLLLAGDAELARIFSKGVADPTSLDENEYVRFTLWNRTFWVRMQNAYSQWHRGTLTDEDWKLYKSTICSNPHHQSMELTLHEHVFVLNDEFRRYIKSCWAEKSVQ
ncbi:hypothetical protein R0135_10105 [Congregibacter variabilis]|uniref:Type IV pilus assembly protein PilV n=1 Tax=Congregibacter variabilis TaxID=3081200 RepID=A0ABZ0HZ19_9GAMM|nr:hypothetical protein R0135_10105 [Congregibacter sp. IMCC43200]